MIVLDANILIRAVLGRRVREILETHFTRVRFFTPDTALAETRERLSRRDEEDWPVLSTALASNV